MRVAVIGGGPAGVFAAIFAKTVNQSADIYLFEKNSKLLNKVKNSGGGRCNVTNNCIDIDQLVTNYPRGKNYLKKIFYVFNPSHTIQWFEKQALDIH